MGVVAVPPLLTLLENVTYPAQLAELRRFYAEGGEASRFKLFIDDACALPADWRSTWDKPLQWGLTGERNWATKYGAAGFIPRMIERSPFVTTDWREASASVVVLFARQYAAGPTIAQQQCLQRLASRSAAFQATNGSNHFFIFTDSRGPCCLDGKYKDVGFLKHHIIGPHGEPDENCEAAPLPERGRATGAAWPSRRRAPPRAVPPEPPPPPIPSRLLPVPTRASCPRRRVLSSGEGAADPLL